MTLTPMELAHLDISDPSQKELELVYLAYFEVGILFAAVQAKVNDAFEKAGEGEPVIPFKAFVDLMADFKVVATETEFRRKQLRTRMRAASNEQRRDLA